MFSTPTQRASRSRAHTPASRAGTPAARAGAGAGPTATGGMFDTSFASSAAAPAGTTPSASHRRRAVRRSRTPFDATGANARAGSVSASRGGTPAPAAASTPVSTTGAGVGAKAFHEAMTADTASVTLQPGTVLVRDAFHAVTAYSRMPTEVAAMLDSADLYSKTCFGYLDIALGLASLATATECFVWSFLAAGPGSSAASASPTCYILPNPSADSSSTQAPPASASADLPYLYTIVPWQSGRRVGEPGLLAVGKRDGEIYFAESITAGTGYTLGGSATAGQLKVSLAYGETITTAHLMTNNTIILATSTARLFRVRVVSSGGRVQLQTTPFSQSRGFLGRLFGGVGSSSGAGAASPSTGVVNDTIIALCTRPLGGPGRTGALDTSSVDGSSAATPASADAGKYELTAVGKRSIQRWHIFEASGAPEKCIASQDVRQLVTAKALDGDAGSSAISGDVALGVDSAGNRRGLEILDASYLVDGSIALLYSHHALGTSSSISKQLGIMIIDSTSNGTSSAAASSSADGGPFFAKRTHPLRGFEVEQDARPYSQPKLAVPFGGPIAFVVLPNSIVAKLLVTEDERVTGEAGYDFSLQRAEGLKDTYQETIHLKEDRFSNRFLAYGVESVDISADVAVAPLPLLTAKSGAVLVEVDWQQARQLTELIQEGDAGTIKSLETDRVKSKLESAVFFGDISYNILEFPLPERSTLENGELVDAALRLSEEITNSTSAYLPSIMDMGAQLADRLHRQLCLIRVIGQSGLTDTLPRNVRDRLCADAQLVAAGQQIWSENSAHASSAGHEQTQLMVKVVDTVMQEAGFGSSDEDLVRAFFRHHLDLLLRVFSMLSAHLKTGNFKEAAAKIKTSHLLQANRIIVPSYYAAANYTDEAGDAYDSSKVFSGPIACEAWTCTAVAIETLETAFHATDALIRERSRELGSAIDMEGQSFLSEGTVEQRQQRELKSHLCELARSTLAAYEQRLSWLQSEEGNAQERQVLLGRFRNIRPQVIHPLQRIGNSDQAFSLAERHRAFRTLAELCTDERAGSEVSITQHYLDRYGKDFAFELFSHYIENGHYRKLLEQDQKYVNLVTEYLSVHPEYDKIAWLHEIGKGEYKDASGTLAHISVAETSLSSKKLELSLAKLAYVADLTEEDIATETEQLNIEEIDNQMDIVNVQVRIKSDVLQRLNDHNALVAAGSEANAFAEMFATRLVAYPALRDLFERCLRASLDGEVLKLEDLVDVLTSKDNEEEGSSDFIAAFETFVRGKESLPESRRRALLQAYWRRVILHDDWEEIGNTAGKTDEEVKETLRATSLYEVITNTEQDDLDSSTLLPTRELLEVPAREVLQGRFAEASVITSLPDQQLDLLVADYQAEVRALENLLESGCEKWIEEARRIAEDDLHALTAAADVTEEMQA